MRQVYAYIRVSTVKQGERGSSLGEQRFSIEAYASRNNLQIIEWFEERETAAKYGRTIFTQMLSLLLKGKATGVIIHKIDRSARNLHDWADLGTLADKGVEIHFAHESVDLKSRGGRLAADIQAVVAADYIRNLRDEVRKGFQGRLRQGFYPLPAPIGYRDEGRAKAKSLDPVMAPHIRQAFQLYATGQYNLRTLGKELHERGLRNTRGGKVSKNGLSTILNNKFYIGIIFIKSTGERYEGKHEPLIPKSLFDRVQIVLNGRAKNTGFKHNFRYRRSLTCRSCSYRLVGELQKGHVYYRCHSGKCPRVSIRQEHIDLAIQNSLESLWLSPEDVTTIEQEFVHLDKDKEAQAEDFRVSIVLNLDNLRTRETRLTDAYIDQAIDKTSYELRKESLFHERRHLQESLNDLTSGNSPSSRRVRKFLELIKRLTTAVDDATPEEKLDLVKEATSNFQADGKSLVFTWNNPFDVLASRGELACGAPHRDVPRTKRVTSIRFAKKLYRLTREEKPPEDTPSAIHK